MFRPNNGPEKDTNYQRITMPSVLQNLRSSNFFGKFVTPSYVKAFLFFFFSEKDLTVNSSNEAAKWICVFTNPRKGKLFFQK